MNSFFINSVQETEIEKLINNLNQNKSLGPCCIPIKILKNHVNVLKQPLTYLINLSFQQGIFPETLKTARVTPIFKKKIFKLSNYRPSNYRPISVLLVFNKLYEKCMYSRLYAFLTKYKLLFKKQFNTLKTQAFNTLNHEILLVTLNFYGIRRLATSWLKSFLENRKHMSIYLDTPRVLKQLLVTFHKFQH